MEKGTPVPDYFAFSVSTNNQKDQENQWGQEPVGSGLAFCMSDFQLRMESKLNLRGPGRVFWYRIELMPLRLARVVFPARIARNEWRRKLRF